MSSDFYEIVELPNGEVVLQRADEEGEPLVSIRFSEGSLSMMQGGKFDVARAMIEAGMEAADELADEGAEDFLGEAGGEDPEPILH